MTLHIFNPSHDEALAAHTDHYCPTRAARRLAHHLSDLPKLWAAEGDACLQLPESGSLEGVARPDWSRVAALSPWGWDRHIVGILRRLGAPEHLLPTDERICTLRMLSSRAAGVEWAEGLRMEGLPDTIRPEVRFCTTTAEVEKAAADYANAAVVKRPWSCSGRGVWIFGDDEATRRRTEKAIAEQGGVEVQRLWHKCFDAALEFTVDEEGTALFDGYSLFATSQSGAYGGNLAAHPDTLRKMLLDRAAECGHPIAESVFAEWTERIRARIEVFFGKGNDNPKRRYVGPMGVDVMVAREGWVPYVEINLRRTMGHVALAIGRNMKTDEPTKLLRNTDSGCLIMDYEE